MGKKPKGPILPRKQLIRLARISALLKKNAYPTPQSLVKEFGNMELYKGLNVACCTKTVLRDIKALRADFGCPVNYDRSAPGYYLKHHGWDFNCPADLSETGMMALILGAKLAEDIFPDPVKSKIQTAVDEILKGNNPDFLDTTCVKSLKIFAEAGAVEMSEVFPIVFEAWQDHRCIQICYDDQRGNISERVVDPHVLFLYNREWRIKAFCRLKNEQRTFVISRILHAKLLKSTFSPDMRIIDSVTLDTLVSYRKILDVKIRLCGNARKFAISNTMHSKQTIKPDEETHILTIPEVSLEVVVPWIMSQKGDAIPLSPAELVDAVKDAAGKILRLC